MTWCECADCRKLGYTQYIAKFRDPDSAPSGGRREAPEWCGTCEKQFNPSTSMCRDGTRLFCGQACFDAREQFQTVYAAPPSSYAPEMTRFIQVFCASCQGQTMTQLPYDGSPQWCHQCTVAKYDAGRQWHYSDIQEPRRTAFPDYLL